MPPIRPELPDEPPKDYRKPEDLLGEDGLLHQLTKALVERALTGELTHYLGYEKPSRPAITPATPPTAPRPRRCAVSAGRCRSTCPATGAPAFEPRLVKKGRTRLDGLNEKIVSLYARGMTQREIRGHLEEIYGAEISPSMVSIVTEMKNRGVSDIFIACVDGLKPPEAIEAVFPQTQVLLRMVHLVHRSLSYVSHKDRKAVAEGLKEVYQAATLEEAERQLTQFGEAWAGSDPVIACSWRSNWVTLRKVTKNRALFPNDEAVFKLLYLALRNISRRWTMPIKNWSGLALHLLLSRWSSLTREF